MVLVSLALVRSFLVAIGSKKGFMAFVMFRDLKGEQLLDPSKIPTTVKSLPNFLKTKQWWMHHLLTRLVPTNKEEVSIRERYYSFLEGNWVVDELARELVERRKPFLS
jgi:hypothetical protein